MVAEALKCSSTNPEIQARAGQVLAIWDSLTSEERAALPESLADEEEPYCRKCPYKLGTVKCFTNPCPECKAGGFKTYKQFVSEVRRRK